MSIVIPTRINQTTLQWASDSTVYSINKILCETNAFYGATDQCKFKLADGVQTWAQLNYFPVSGYDDATSSIQTQFNNISGGNISFPRRPASWYCSAINAFAPGTQAHSKDVIRMTPFIVSEPTALTEIGMEISGAGSAGSVVRLGIYNSTDKYPSTNLLNAGTIAGDSATNQTIAISITLQPGLYWLAFYHNSAANITFRSIPFTQYVLPAILGLIAGSFTGNQYNIAQMSYVYDGTLPTISGSSVTGNNVGLVAVKTSA